MRAMLYVKISMLVFAFSVLIIIVMLAYNRVAKPVVVSDIPLVSSDKCMTKMPPENPGGMVISNQNKMIYDPIKSEKAGKSKASRVTSITTKLDKEDKLGLLQEIGVEKLSKLEYEAKKVVSGNNENSVFDFAKEGNVENKSVSKHVQKDNKSIEIAREKVTGKQVKGRVVDTPNQKDQKKQNR